MIIRVPESAGSLYERIQYPAGELQVRLPKATIRALHEAKEIRVLCREAHRHLMELALLGDCLHYERPFAESTLVMPYLPYGRADRRFVEGDCHGLETFGNAINSMHFNRVRSLDVHSYRAKRFVSRLEDVSAHHFINQAVHDICDKGGHPVVLLPDEGAKRYGLDAALQCHKKRDAATGKLSGFEVPALDDRHDVLVVDDICDGGGTFIGLAQAITKKYGYSEPSAKEPLGGRRKKLYLYITHGIFSKGLQELLQYFERIYVTHSLPLPHSCMEALAAKKIVVFECEKTLLGEAS